MVQEKFQKQKYKNLILLKSKIKLNIYLLLVFFPLVFLLLVFLLLSFVKPSADSDTKVPSRLETK